MSARAIFVAAAVLLLTACGSSGARPADESSEIREQPIPADLRSPVARSEGVGRMLYMLDMVAAVGTDVLIANVGDPRSKGLAGYLLLPEGHRDQGPTGAFVVFFYTPDDPPKIAYQIRVVPNQTPSFEAFNPPKEAPEGFAELVRARQVAIDTIPEVVQPINPLVLPVESNEDQGLVVYLLAGTTRPNLAILGRHYRALVSRDGTRVIRFEALSKSVLEIPTRGPNGEAVESLAVTHITTDFPLETHVFASLLVKLPIHVVTRRGIWQVTGDRIAFMGTPR